MKFHHPLLVRFFGFIFFLILRLWTKSLRYRFAFLDGRKHPTPVSKDRFIYAFWHDLIFVPTAVRLKIHVLVSKHRDGEWLAQICKRMGVGVVRGSTNRGGTDAMRQLIAKGRETHLSVTPDGPRGPRRRVHIGLIYLASRSGLPIVPCGVGMSQSWRLCSWDRFAVPIPFSAVTIIYGEPVFVPANLGREHLEEYRKTVEEQINKVTHTAQMWAERKRSRWFHRLHRSIRRRLAGVGRMRVSGER